MSGFNGIDIIDPDAIVRNIESGDLLLQAARASLRRRREALDAGRSHLVETTLAGSSIIPHMAAVRLPGRPA